jgi:hypothetical protein
MRVPLDAEAGVKIDAFYMYSLVEHHARGQHGIQTTGYQGNRLSLNG